VTMMAMEWAVLSAAPLVFAQRVKKSRVEQTVPLAMVQEILVKSSDFRRVLVC